MKTFWTQLSRSSHFTGYHSCRFSPLALFESLVLRDVTPIVTRADTKELLDRMKNGWQRPGAAAALMDSDEEDDMDLPPDILRRRRLAARAAARARDEAFGELLKKA